FQQQSGAGMRWEPPLIAIGLYDWTVSKVCPFTLQAGTLTPAGNCLSPPGGQTADGYWTYSTGQLSRTGFKDGAFRLLETFPVPISYGSSFPPSLFTTSDDPDRPGWMLLRLRLQPGGAAYEAYALGPSHALVERDYFWWNQESGGTEVMVP